jgi:Bacterial PH domain
MYFKAKYNRTAVFPMGILPIILGFPLLFFYSFVRVSVHFLAYGLLIFCITVWALLFARSITHYVLQEDAIVVYKRVGKVVIKYKDIFAVEPCTTTNQDGIALSQNYEDMYWYTTTQKNNVAIYIEHKKLLLSPENKDLFIQALQKKINQHHVL